MKTAFEIFGDKIKEAWGKEFPQSTCKISFEFGEKFVRVVHATPHKGVHSLVALSDGSNKTLGPWSTGDLFYPAGWKGPAKVIRGNILIDKFEDIITCYAARKVRN